MTNLDLDFLKRVTPGVRGAGRATGSSPSRTVAMILSAALVAAVGFTSIAAHAQSADDSAAPAPKAKKAKASKSSKQAAKSKAAAGKTGPSASKGKLSRDVVFDGSVVNGKYLASGEAVSTVENEKKLNNLIGMRADFKDRLGDQRAQLRSASDK